MTSKLIVNSLAADTGVSTITFADQAKMGNSLFHSTGFTIGDSFLHSTGVNLTNINATGVITATKFVGEVSVGSSITFEDNEKAYFGTGTDFSIYHNGSASYLDETGTGGLIVKTDTAFQVFNSAGSQAAFTVTPGGSVQLYHNNIIRAETTASGFQITNGALDIVNNGGSGASLRNYSAGVFFLGNAAQGDFALYCQDNTNNSIILQANSGEKYIECNMGGSVDLYHHNDGIKLSTTASGVSLFGDVDIADKIIHTGDTNTAIRFPAADTISMETAGDQHLRIASDGNVGIGTNNNNPTSKLHIVVDGVGQGIHIANKENLYPTASTGYSDIKFSFRDYQAGGSSGAPAIIRGQSHNAGATSRSSKLVFLTSSSDGTNTPTEKMRIEYDGRIAVNQPAGTGFTTGKVHIKSSASNIGQLYLEQNNATDGFMINQDGPNGGHLKFIRDIGGTQTVNVLFRSDKGICFNGDSSTANALDDYEEGSWTPLVRNSSGTGTAGSANYGYYTKVGNIVHAHATVHWTALNSGTTDTYAKVVGFPFPSKNSTNYRCQHVLGAQVVGVQAGGAGYNLSLAFDGNSSHAFLLGVNSASTGGSNYTHTPTLNSSGTIYGLSITYLTDT